MIQEDNKTTINKLSEQKDKIADANVKHAINERIKSINGDKNVNK